MPWGRHLGGTLPGPARGWGGGTLPGPAGGRGYPAGGGGCPAGGVPCLGVTLPRGVPCLGGYPGRVPLGQVRMGGTLLGGTQLEQHREYLLHGRRYASCVHAGGLSCFDFGFEIG